MTPQLRPLSLFIQMLVFVLTLGAARYALAEPPPQPHLKTVFVIVFENHNWSQIKGNRKARYINQDVLPIAAYTEHYFTPKGNHPSLPNYVWMESGKNWGIKNDGSPSKNHQSTDQHLVALLNKANPSITWKAYQEDISGNECPLTDVNRYRTKHNPFVYFDDVTDRLNPRSASCIAHIRPLTELAPDLRSGKIARYNFITPNIGNDMHLPPGTIEGGDNWLRKNLPDILDSNAFKDGGVIFVAWDEGSGDTDGPLGLIVLSPLAKRGPASDATYTHSSLLKTIQEIFGVKPLLGDAMSEKTNDLRELFVSFP